MYISSGVFLSTMEVWIDMIMDHRPPLDSTDPQLASPVCVCGTASLPSDNRGLTPPPAAHVWDIVSANQCFPAPSVQVN